MADQVNDALAQPRATLKGGSPAVVVAFTRDEPPPPAPPSPPEPETESDTDTKPSGADTTSYGPSNPYRIGDLKRGDLSEATFALKRDTYLAHVTRSSKSRTFVGTLHKSELGVVGHGSKFKMRLDAAEAVNDLLQAARADLAKERSSGDFDAVATKSVGVCSTYRSADVQFGLWDKRFIQYLDGYCAKHDLTYEEVEPSALAKHIGARTACPGYSNHQSGLAVDFSTLYDGAHLRAGSRDKWVESWFYLWLLQHADARGFDPLKGEPWHWTFRG